MRTYAFLTQPHALSLVTALLAVVFFCALSPTETWAKRKPHTPKTETTIPTSPLSLEGETADTGKSSATTPGNAPKKVMIVGDSFAVGLGMTMEQSLHSPKTTLSSRGKVSSGLNSPHFYDWEQALAAFLDSEKPDTLVVMLGANDAKNGRGTPEWARDFQAKAARFLAIAGKRGVSVYWVGLPPMREKAFSQRTKTANEAMQAACAAVKSCHFVNSWDLFADNAGMFCAQKSLGGKAVSLRGKDGVHFSAAGCRLLTDRVAKGLTPAP